MTRANRGKRVSISGIYITRYANGKASRHGQFDFLSLYRQLGAIPARGRAAIS